MSISSGSLDISIFPSGGGGGSLRAVKLTIKASHVDPDTGTRRTWTATRSEKDFSSLGVALMGQLGGSTLERPVPSPPPEGSSPATFQAYLRRLVVLPEATTLPVLYEFLDTPAELVQEPVLFGEVRLFIFVSGNFQNFACSPSGGAGSDA